MGKQQEKPGIDLRQLAENLNVSSEGAVASGGQIMNFREGWAIYIMGGHARGHYYRRSTRDISRAVSLCGRDVPVQWLYGQGNHPICTRCKFKARHLKEKHPVPAPVDPQPSGAGVQGKTVFDRVQAYLQKYGPTTGMDLAEQVGPSSPAALKELRDLGMIVQDGKQGQTKIWKLTEENQHG